MAHSLLHSLYLLCFLQVLEFLVHRISFLSMPDPKSFPRCRKAVCVIRWYCMLGCIRVIFCPEPAAVTCLTEKPEVTDLGNLLGRESANYKTEVHCGFTS